MDTKPYTLPLQSVCLSMPPSHFWTEQFLGQGYIGQFCFSISCPPWIHSRPKVSPLWPKLSFLRSEISILRPMPIIRLYRPESIISGLKSALSDLFQAFQAQLSPLRPKIRPLRPQITLQPSQIKIRPSDWKKLPFVGSQGPLPHYLIFTITNNINGASGTYDRWHSSNFTAFAQPFSLVTLTALTNWEKSCFRLLTY